MVSLGPNKTYKVTKVEDFLSIIYLTLIRKHIFQAIIFF